MIFRASPFFSFILFFGFFLSACQPSSSVNHTNAAPNIILLITDDQGWGDLGFHGNPDVKTPTLDAFAKQATRFTSFYVSPVCAPTRASLMTGRYSLRTGVYDTYNGGAVMSTKERTIAEILADQGYATGVFGKWHLGDNYPSRPNDQGFQESLIHRSGGMAQVGDVTTYFQFDSAYFDPVLVENGLPVKKEGYCSDIFTDGAIRFMEDHQEGPFFLYLSFNAPHTPLQLPGRYEDQYANLEIDSSGYPRFERAFPQMRPRDVTDARKVYGMVSNIDDNIGRLLDRLEALNLRENTLVIFMTDNGPQQVRYTGGFRGRKGTVYEGGIRVPCFMQWPGQVEEDKEIETTAVHMDILPTLLDIAGISVPDNIDGHSLVPLLDGKEVPWADRPLFFTWRRGFPEPYWNIAVRKGDYKLVGNTDHNAEVSDFELFNLDKDPSELHNLSSKQMDITENLKEEFDQWYTEIIESPHLENTPIILGAPQDNPTILNRNDAKGSWGIWAENEVFGYWDIEVEEPGFFNFTCHFKDTLPASGHFSLRIHKVQRSVDHDQLSQPVKLENIWLPKSAGRLEAVYWLHGKDVRIFPFYIEVEKVSNPNTL